MMSYYQWGSGAAAALYTGQHVPLARHAKAVAWQYRNSGQTARRKEAGIV